MLLSIREQQVITSYFSLSIDLERDKRKPAALKEINEGKAHQLERSYLSADMFVFRPFNYGFLSGST